MATTTTPSTARIALRYGIIVGLASCMYWVVIILVGLPMDHPAQYLSYVFIIAGLVYAMKEFKSQNGGYMRYGQGLGLGTLTAAVSGLISGIFTTFYLKVIDDTPMKQLWDAQRAKMEEQGMSDAQIEQAVAMGQKFSSFGIVFGILGGIVLGFLLSLIIAAILKKDQDVLEV